MSGAIQLGPMLVPVTLLLFFASFGCAQLVGRRLGRASGADVETWLWYSLLVGLLVARLGFVWQFRAAYLASPLDIIDIRDGGWSPTAGFVGAWLFALSRQKSSPALAGPLRHALLAGTLVWAAGQAAMLTLQEPTQRTLPALELGTLEGGTVRLDRFAGRPTVINLWATWCPPCAREMPVLQKAQLDRPDIHFVFLNQGETAEQVRAWLAQRQLPLRNVLIDGKGRASAAFDHQGYPATLFFDAKGRLVSTRIGELSSATLHERLERIRP